MTNKSVLFLSVFFLAASQAHAQAQKQIPLGGGFMLNTKIPQEVSYKGLNALFPIRQMDRVPSFRPLYAPAAREDAPTHTDQVRTLCGEWVAKSSAVPVYEGQNWYVQKGSQCARDYYSNWLSQQDFSFVKAAETRIQCEGLLPKTDVKMHVCPVCGKPIDARCGAVASVRDEHNHSVYMHDDCRLKTRHDAKARALRETLGLTDEPLADKQPVVIPPADKNVKTAPVSAAPSRLQVKANVTASLRDIKIKLQPLPVQSVRQEARTSGKGDMDAFISQNGTALNAAARKKRAGKILDAREAELLDRFETLRRGYGASAALQTPVLTAQAEGVPVQKPAVKPAKKITNAPAENVKVSSFPAANSSYAARRRAGVPAEKLLKKSPIAEQPVFRAPEPAQEGSTHLLVTKKDISLFEKANKKNMELIRVVAQTGAQSDAKTMDAAARYKELLDGYAYSQTPEGRLAAKRVKEFEEAHAKDMKLIRQWMTYGPEKAPAYYRDLITGYRQVLQAGNLHK